MLNLCDVDRHVDRHFSLERLSLCTVQAGVIKTEDIEKSDISIGSALRSSVPFDSASFQKRAPMPLPGNEQGRPRRAEVIPNDFLQEEGDVGHVDVVAPEPDIADATQEPSEDRRMLRDRTGRLTKEEKAASWNMLRGDLENVPGIRAELDAYFDVDQLLPLNTPPPKDGVIPWNIHPTHGTLLRLERRLRANARQRRADHKRDWERRRFIEAVNYNQVPAWPRLEQPEYHYFQQRYDMHIHTAQQYYYQREWLLAMKAKHERRMRGEEEEEEEVSITQGQHDVQEDDDEDDEAQVPDPSTFEEPDFSYRLKLINEQMKNEASKAFDIFLTLQLTYRNMIINLRNLHFSQMNPRYNRGASSSTSGQGNGGDDDTSSDDDDATVGGILVRGMSRMNVS